MSTCVNASEKDACSYLGNVALEVFEDDDVAARGLDEQLGEHLGGFLLVESKERENPSDNSVEKNEGREKRGYSDEGNVEILSGKRNRVSK